MEKNLNFVTVCGWYGNKINYQQKSQPCEQDVFVNMNGHLDNT